jgi:hypothetical protein
MSDGTKLVCERAEKLSAEKCGYLAFRELDYLSQKNKKPAAGGSGRHYNLYIIHLLFV